MAIKPGTDAWLAYAEREGQKLARSYKGNIENLAHVRFPKEAENKAFITGFQKGRASDTP